LVAHLAGDEQAPPMLIDADALNALAAAGDWPHPRHRRWVLTPHPGEMSRLMQTSTQEIQADRLGVARARARDWRQIVVLKGAPSIVAGPHGAAHLNAFANAALATAGPGDAVS